MSRGDEKSNTGDEVICEFFGIKITTKNPSLARVLTADVADVMRLDVSDVKDFISDENYNLKKEEEEPDPEINTNWKSISTEVNKINKLLEESEETTPEFDYDIDPDTA